MNKTKVFLIGANGKLGKRVIKELEKFDFYEVVKFSGDAKSYTELKSELGTASIIISTVGARSVEELTDIAANVIRLAKEKGIRVVWSGGAGSLRDKNGKRLVDTPIAEFPKEMAAWIPAVYGHSMVLKMFEASELKHWTFMSPALDFKDENATAPYKLKVSDDALYNTAGMSYASYQSGAEALVAALSDEELNGKRFTIVEGR